MTEVDVGELRNREGAAIERVVKYSLLSASDGYDEAPEDPGWTADYHEDELRDAIVEAGAAIENRRRAEGKPIKEARNGA